MKHFLSAADLNREELLQLFQGAAQFKAELAENPLSQRGRLAGKTLAMVFQKPSLRTRVSFDVGMNQLGGHTVYLSPAEIGLGSRESVPDIARVLSRMCDVIVGRVFEQEDIHLLAQYGSVPVINGLSNLEHPCQALADYLTLQWHKGLEGRTLAYVGDGNNVCHSLMLMGAILGVKVRVATPEKCRPDAAIVSQARKLGTVEVGHDPRSAVAGADAVYTDVWVSMGLEVEQEQNRELFPPYRLDSNLLALAAPDAIVMHCLPAHRGEEITDEVMESPQSVVFDQAENRLHAQKALMVYLLDKR